MNKFRNWLNEEIAQKKLEHAALFDNSTTYTEEVKLQDLENEIKDLRTALVEHFRYQRMTGEE